MSSAFSFSQIDQGGLTLPRDYYLNESYVKVVDAYLQYMTKVGASVVIRGVLHPEIKGNNQIL